MTDHIEVTCPCQRDHKMPLSWCNKVQYQQLCAGCVHNEGRKRSKYQQEQDRRETAGSRRKS